MNCTKIQDVAIVRERPRRTPMLNFGESKENIHTDITITLFNKFGVVKIINVGENVITYPGRSNMAHLFAGDDVANRRVHQFKFGNGGHNPIDPTQSLATSPSDTELFGDLVIAKTASYSFPNGDSGNKVMFEATIEENEGNGTGVQALSEVGLYDVEGRMLSHKTFGLITKSADLGVLFHYSFLF